MGIRASNLLRDELLELLNLRLEIPDFLDNDRLAGLKWAEMSTRDKQDMELPTCKASGKTVISSENGTELIFRPLAASSPSTSGS